MAGGSARERCGGIGPGPAAAAALRRPGRRCTLEAHWRARGRGGSPTRVGTYFIVGLFFGIARLVILNEIVPQQLPCRLVSSAVLEGSRAYRSGRLDVN